jgi:hypothetical protein
MGPSGAHAQPGPPGLGGLARKRVLPVTDLRAVTSVGLGRWKLVSYHGQEPQLFDLQEDTDELADRAPDLACHEI